MRILSVTVFALSLSVLGGCKAIDAMDATDAMKKDLAAMKATTSGMATTTEDMKNTTEELKRKASLGEGLKLFEATENNQEFAPPSKGLLAGAKLIAENMTVDELTTFYKLGLKEINNTAPKEIENDRTLLGGYTPRYIADFNLKKQVQLIGLQAIAAQVPQKRCETKFNPDTNRHETICRKTASIEQIIKEQLQGEGGSESDATLVLLMLRAKFTNEFILDSTIFAAGVLLDNLGKLKNAMKYARNLQFLTELSFIDRIAYKNSSTAFLAPIIPAEKIPGEKGCVTPAELKNNKACKPSLGTPVQFDEKLDRNIAKRWFKTIVLRIESEMPEDMRGPASPYAREIAELKAEAKRYSGMN